jgi:hypothetical protein
MPLRITNNTGSPIVIADMGFAPISASGIKNIKFTNRWAKRLENSKILQKLAVAGDISIEVPSVEAEDTFDGSDVDFPVTTGQAYIAARKRTPLVAKTSGQTVILPNDPKDGEIIFSPVHRLEFYWDAVRGKWLTVVIFELILQKETIAVGDYLELFGVPSAGFQFPFPGVAVTWNAVAGTGATADTIFSLEKNGVEVQTFTVNQDNKFQSDLQINWDIDMIAATDEGYKVKVKSSTGTPPQNLIINMAYLYYLEFEILR